MRRSHCFPTAAASDVPRMPASVPLTLAIQHPPPLVFPLSPQATPPLSLEQCALRKPSRPRTKTSREEHQ